VIGVSCRVMCEIKAWYKSKELTTDGMSLCAKAEHTRPHVCDMTEIVLSGSGDFCSHIIHPSILSQP
jgi:hypothetical protein